MRRARMGSTFAVRVLAPPWASRDCAALAAVTAPCGSDSLPGRGDALRLVSTASRPQSDVRTQGTSPLQAPGAIDPPCRGGERMCRRGLGPVLTPGCCPRRGQWLGTSSSVPRLARSMVGWCRPPGGPWIPRPPLLDEGAAQWERRLGSSPLPLCGPPPCEHRRCQLPRIAEPKDRVMSVLGMPASN
jgi:hypothetical protein